MKKIFFLLVFTIMSIMAFSQVRVNVVRVAGDSTDISPTAMPAGTMVIDMESNTIYLLPSGCAASTALYEITEKYPISAIRGENDGTAVLSNDIDPPVTIPKYMIFNPNGTIDYVSGSGGVDTLWLKVGSYIENRPDITLVKTREADLEVHGNAEVYDTLYVHEKIKNPLDVHPGIAGGDQPDPGNGNPPILMNALRLVALDQTDSMYYYIPINYITNGIYSGFVSDTSADFIAMGDTTDFVGIGLNSPTEQLDVFGDVKGDTAVFNYYLNTTGIAILGDTILAYNYGITTEIDTLLTGTAVISDSLLWYESLGEIFNKDNKPVEVTGEFRLSNLTEETRVGYILGINETGDGNVYPIQIGTLLDTASYSGGFWDRDSTKNAVFPMELTDNIGIGTASPTHIIDITGNPQINGSLIFKNNSSGDTAMIYMDNGDLMHISKLSSAIPELGIDFAEDRIDVRYTINITSALPSNNMVSGVTATHTAGENLTIGQICYMKSDGKLWKADADSSIYLPALWMATGSISENATGEFLVTGGYARYDSWNWTKGKLLFTSVTAGGMTQNASEAVGGKLQPVGVAVTEDIVHFVPAPIYTPRDTPW